MPSESLIEWTDATWNPVTGCSKVSQGCKNCYAEAIFGRAYGKRAFTDVRIHPERLMWPLRWKGSKQAKAEGRPSRIFVNSMSDLFHDHVPLNFIAAVHMVAVLRPDLIFQILTKRPLSMLHFHSQKHRFICTLREKGIWIDGARGDYQVQAKLAKELERGLSLPDCEDALGGPLPNVWLGVSVEDQKTADERIPILLQTPAAVRWVSYEPALGRVDFTQIGNDGINVLIGRQPHWHHDADGEMWNPGKLDWIVAGGESGPHARMPHADWFRSVRDQCQEAGVPFFFKQWGAWVEVPAVQQPTDVSMFEYTEPGAEPSRPCVMRFVGKKKAGCLLDGREWKEFPKRDKAV